MIRELFLEDLSLWNCLWQSTLLVVIGLVGGFLLRHRPARAFQVLFLGMMAAIVVPAVSVLVKHFELGAFVAEPIALQRDVSSMPMAMPFEAPVVLAEPQANAERPLEAALADGSSADIRIPWRVILLLGWTTATLALLGRLLVAFINGVRLIRRSQPEVREHIQHALDRARARLGIVKDLQIRASGEIHSPMIWGWSRRAVLLVPRELDHNVDWVGVFCHELAHCLRWDHISGLLAELTTCILCWNPLSWLAKKRLVRLSEQACDDWVVAGGQPAENYARALLNFKPQKQAAFVPAVVHSKKGVAARVRRILKDSCVSPRTGTKWALATTLAALCLTLGVALAQTRPAKAPTETQGDAKPTKSLHEAAIAGDVEQVKSLISKGADINAKDKDGRTPLHSAALYGRKNVAEVLIAKGANINETDVSGQTPLHLAASFASRFVPELLLAKGANVNARDKAGNTPLHIAAGYRGSSKDFLEFLLAKGADVNARNDKGETPLHLVPKTTKQNIRRELAADALLANGADINAKDKSGCTPLHFAAANGQGKVVELLLAKGADSKAKATDGTTTLHRAVMSGRSDVVALLLDRGLDINSAQSDGWTALHYSAMMGTNEIAELLISRGADVNAKTVRGETPVHLAVVQNRRDTVTLLLSKGAEVSTIQIAAYLGDLAKVKSFIEKGVSVNTQEGYWPTPLQAAAAAGQREVAEFLISKGALVNAEAVAQGGATALHYAALGGSKEVVELLISKGAVIDARDKNGLKALPPAAMVNYMGIVKLFTASEANAKDKDGWTPLHYAARSGHKDVVLLLIDHGADVNAEAPDKSKPLDYAAWSDHKDKDMVKLLIDKGTNISKDDDLLYWSCMYGYRDLAELLIKKGADVNSKAWGHALSLEVVWNRSSSQLDILKLLLDNGADPNAKDRWDWSLLHYTEGNVDLTRLLLDKGANPNAIENERGLMPLHLAADRGRKAMVELLISRGADVNAKDYSRRTPLSYAEDLGSNDMYGRPRDTPLTIEAKSAKKEVAELLRKHGAKD